MCCVAIYHSYTLSLTLYTLCTLYYNAIKRKFSVFSSACVGRLFNKNLSSNNLYFINFYKTMKILYKMYKHFDSPCLLRIQRWTFSVMHFWGKIVFPHTGLPSNKYKHKLKSWIIYGYGLGFLPLYVIAFSFAFHAPIRSLSLVKFTV